jgi:hypothetical protein
MYVPSKLSPRTEHYSVPTDLPASTTKSTTDGSAWVARPIATGSTPTRPMTSRPAPKQRVTTLRPQPTHGHGRHNDRNAARHHSNSDHGRLGNQYRNRHSNLPTNATNTLAPSDHHDLPRLAPTKTMPLLRNTNTVLSRARSATQCTRLGQIFEWATLTDTPLNVLKHHQGNEGIREQMCTAKQLLATKHLPSLPIESFDLDGPLRSNTNI